ncbi:MAG: hypothetical protein EAZ40_17890 [Rhodobacterales bacterium]|nr:MAG: hypothetical protein EAZ40_17890 [Rhodobacterales bacterium]
MSLISLVLPLAQITFLTPPSTGAETQVSTPLFFFSLLVVALVCLWAIKAVLRPSRRHHLRQRSPNFDF